jgi:phosphoribosylformylglycinamidine synthase
MKAIVKVGLKSGVLDAQGKAVETALRGLGFGAVEGARVGKVIELDLGGMDRATAETQVKAMCERLLANTVIETYSYEITA